MIKFKANPPPTEGTWKIGETEVPVGADQGSFKSGSFTPGVCIFFPKNNIEKISQCAKNIFFLNLRKNFISRGFLPNLLAAVEKIYENIQTKY